MRGGAGHGRRFRGTLPMLLVAMPGVLACAAVIAATPHSDLASPLTVALGACAVLGTFVSVDLEGTLFWDGSFVPLACAVAFLDPASVAAIAVLTEISVYCREQYRPPVFVLNLFGIAPNVLAAWVMTSLAPSVSSAGFFLVFGLVISGAILLNLVSVTVLIGIYYDQPIWSRLRQQTRLLPAVGINVVLAFASVGVYRSEGIAATVLVISGVFVFAYVANRLATEHEQRLRIESLASSRGRLVAQLLETEDRERRAVARVLHDDVIQTLLVARQDLSEVERAGGNEVGAVISLLDDAVGQVRGTISVTHPSVLERVGLEAALKTIAEQAAARGGFHVDVEVDQTAREMHDRLVFTAARELLSNAARHSGATRVAICVKLAGTELLLVVDDNGVGIDHTAAQRALGEGHIGLESVRERVEAVGGTVEIQNGSDHGTSIRVTLPTEDAGRVAPRRDRDGAPDSPAAVELARVSEH